MRLRVKKHHKRSQCRQRKEDVGEVGLGRADWGGKLEGWWWGLMREVLGKGPLGRDGRSQG